MRFKTLINVNVKWKHRRHSLEHDVNISEKELLEIEKQIVASNPYISKVFEILPEVEKKQPSQIVSKEEKKDLGKTTPTTVEGSNADLRSQYFELFGKNPHPAMKQDKLKKKIQEKLNSK